MVITVCATEDLGDFKQGTVIVWFSKQVSRTAFCTLPELIAFSLHDFVNDQRT